MRGRDFDLHIAAWRRSDRLRAGKVDRFVLAAASCHLPTGRIESFDHYFNNLPYMLGIIHPLDLPLAIKQYLKPGSFFRLRDGIDHYQRRRIGPRRVLETEDAIVLDLGEQVHCLDEVLL